MIEDVRGGGAIICKEQRFVRGEMFPVSSSSTTLFAVYLSVYLLSYPVLFCSTLERIRYNVLFNEE